jgi:hypothetical protein
MKSRALKVDRNCQDKYEGERAREENLRKRIAAESRIRSVLQGRIPNSTYIDMSPGARSDTRSQFWLPESFSPGVDVLNW